MELMARYEDNYFDLAIVDPPYRDENQPIKEMRSNGSMESLEGRPTQKYWSQLFRVSKNQIIWGANNFELPQWKGFVVWNKKITGVKEKYSQCEIASLSQGISTISSLFEYGIQNVPETKIHPTQKPVKLYEWLLINYAKEGDKILDTHLGSGSIAIACHNLGFDLTACELDKDYFEAAIKRLKQHQAQLTMF
jgi:site-specific DNA-methyltransferase (adenine-specific)